jgi:hypothetical protein
MLFAWLLALAGILYVLMSQYFDSPEVTLSVKIAIPSIITFLIIWNLNYKAWQQGVERKLIAIATASELGKVGSTGIMMGVFLDAFGLIVPIAMIATLFIIGGDFLKITGIMLFECLACYSLVLIGKILTGINSNDATRKQEAQKDDQFAEKVADKMAQKIGPLTPPPEPKK